MTKNTLDLKSIHKLEEAFRHFDLSKVPSLELASFLKNGLGVNYIVASVITHFLLTAFEIGQTEGYYK